MTRTAGPTRQNGANAIRRSRCRAWSLDLACRFSGLASRRRLGAHRDVHLRLLGRRGGGDRRDGAPGEAAEIWGRLDANPPSLAVVLKPAHVRDIDVFVERYGVRAFGPSLFWRKN